MLYWTVAWLGGLGLFRRLLSSVTAAGQADPLVVVGAASICLLGLAAIGQGGLRSRSRLAAAVLALNALTLLGAFNPLQHSLSAGITALLFVLVPPLAFWVGRVFCDDAVLTRVLHLFCAISVLVAGYGLSQTFGGFPSWDARWIHDSGYAALIVGTVVRPFGASSSAAEYATFLGVGVVAWMAFGLSRARLPVTMCAVALLGVALFYSAVRSVLVLTVVGLYLMVAAVARLSAARALLGGALVLGVAVIVIGHVRPSAEPGAAGAQLTSHQLSGLAHPLDPRSSTFIQHYKLAAGGVRAAVAHPVGLGISTVNIAGTKAGVAYNLTEEDPSNVSVAMGMPGLLAYVVVLVLGLRLAVRTAARRRDPVALAAVGILLVTLFQWFNGGQYSVAFLPWLFLGWLDGLDNRRAQGDVLPSDRHTRATFEEWSSGLITRSMPVTRWARRGRLAPSLAKSGSTT